MRAVGKRNDDRLYAYLTAIIDAGVPCPTSIQIASALGMSRAGVEQVLKRLSNQGRIKVFRGSHARVIEINGDAVRDGDIYVDI